MKLFRRLDYWFNRRKYEAELAEEMQFHREQSGAPEFGNRMLAREDARAVWIWPWLESVLQDLRYALRNLMRQPGFALIALATLGIAIGLNTALFTVFDAVAWRQLPVKDPARVVKILAQPIANGRVHGFSVAEYRYFRDHAKTLSGVVALNDERVHLGFEPFGKGSGAMFVSANYFDVLGVPMDRGRGFLPEEDQLDQPEAAAVLSYATWRDHYNADSTIIGKQIRVDEVPFTVVGVAGEEFTGSSGGREDVYMPLAALQLVRPTEPSTRAFLRNPDHCCTPIAGRMSPGATRTEVEAELSVLSRQFHSENKLDPGMVLTADSTVLAGHPKRRSIMPVFALMFTGVLLVLLLACANVSNLLIARSAARQHEIDVRRAIGAGRGRIVRQLLTEGFAIAAGSAAIGLALGWNLPGYIFSQIEGPNVRLTPDLRVMAYAVGLAALTCVAFALAPALQVSRSGARGKSRLRSALLIAQVAMSVVLLISAGLMIAGVQHARTQDPLFRIADISVISFELPASAYDARRTRQFSEALSRELSGMADFQDVAIADLEPLSPQHSHTSFRLPAEPPKTEHEIDVLEVSAGYFPMVEVPIVAGRNFTAGDEARNAIIINEATARRYFPNESAVGKTIVRGTRSHEIVGVARDAYLTYLDGIGPLMFVPFTGEDIPKLLVRTKVPGAADTIAQAARRIEPRTRTQAAALAGNLDTQLAESNMMAKLAGGLGGFALILATIGMSGVFAYVVEQRTKEIGIRMALGAEPGQVIALVLAGTARSAMIGLAIGFAASAGVAKLLAQYLYGASPYDPRAYFAVASILILSGLAAAYVPARRATKVDPLHALRVE